MSEICKNNQRFEWNIGLSNDFMMIDEWFLDIDLNEIR